MNTTPTLSRPKSWHELPYRIQEWLIHNTADLDYDPYRGSLADAESILLNSSNRGYSNDILVQKRYESLNDAELKKACVNMIDMLTCQITTIETFLNNKI